LVGLRSGRERAIELLANPPLVVGLLVNGLAYGAIFIVVAFLVSRFTPDIVGRSLLVIALFVAALVYVVFAIRAGESAFWVIGELVGAAIFGGMALLGLRGSPYWIAAAWALHPLWDVVLHYFGPGYSFAPVGYTIACVSFDLLVAVYIAIAYGLLGGRRVGFRNGST
jgi:hypothetical protein